MNMMVGLNLYVEHVTMCFIENVNDEENTNAPNDGAYSLVNHAACLNTSTLLLHWYEIS